MKEAIKKMKSKHLLSLGVILNVMIILFWITPALAQAPDSIVTWPENPMGRIRSSQVASGGMRLANVNEPLEIVNVAVDGKPIIIGEAFAGTDNWIRNFTVKVRNISDQEIHSILMSIVLPDVTLNGRSYGFSLRGGSTPAGKEKAILPGEEVELKWIEIEYQLFKEKSAQLSGVDHILKARIGMTSVIFTDRTLWGSDCLRATNPRNSCPHRAP